MCRSFTYLLFCALLFPALSFGQDVVSAEYFFDNDPGIGNGTAVAINVPSDSIDFDLSINSSGLDAGQHRLFVRTQDDRGVWSNISGLPIWVEPRIEELEYFVDTDPGIGNGTSISVAPTSDSVDVSSSISSAGISAGHHDLYIRSRDERNVWSLHAKRPIFVGTSIVAVEYFFDTDPGIGNATAIPVSATVDSIDFNAALNTSGLSSGHHEVYVRTKDNNGMWSEVGKRHVFISGTIVAAEYFYDTDPGIGNATPIPVSATVDSIDFNAALSTSGLSLGHHEVYVRTKNSDNVWSEIGKRHVFVSGNIVAAEYFFDEDPGIGNGSTIPITPTLDSIDFNGSINISSVEPGFHLLYVRTKNDGGKWSHHTRRRVFIEKEIVAAEYFFDIDPGVGLATSMGVGNIADSVDWDLSFIMPLLPQGDHTMYIRTTDSYGVWSHYSWPDTVEVTSPVGVEESPNELFEVYSDIGVVYVKTNEILEDAVGLKLYDLTGREVMSKSGLSLNDGVTAIPVSGLPFATYLVELKTEDRIFVQKVILK